MDSDRPIGVYRPTGATVTVSGVRKADRKPIVLRRTTAAATCTAALAVAGLLAAPAAAAASVRILNDPLTAQGELVNAQTWAEVAGSITFGASVEGDTVVALTGSPRRRCPQQPPPGIRSNPGPGADAESMPVLADGDDEFFVLTPTRREVTGQSTRLCAYLLRKGVLMARGSRRLKVALAASSGGSNPGGRSAGGGNGVSAKGALALLLVVLAAIGVVVTLHRLLHRRPSTSGSQQPPEAARTGPPIPPTSHPSAAGSRGAAPDARRRRHGQPAPPSGNRQNAADGGNGATRVTPRDSGSTGVAVDRRDVERLLRHVRFTKHAIEQFATRAGVPLTSYGHIELLIRELLRREGKVTTERPFWSRSSNTADLYLQAGDWMLFILLRDRWLPWRYTCVTAVNGPQENTWENALRRGYIHTPPRAPGLN